MHGRRMLIILLEAKLVVAIAVIGRVGSQPLLYIHQDNCDFEINVPGDSGSHSLQSEEVLLYIILVIKELLTAHCDT